MIEILLVLAGAAVLAVLVWLDGYGQGLGREQDLRVYSLNEQFRAEKGRAPVPWPGTMAAYNAACRRIDGSD
jgi:hypothetical protein